MKPWILVPAIAAILMLSGCSRDGGEDDNGGDAISGARDVVVTPVTEHDFARSFQATGSLMPREQANIRALVDGPLEAVHVDIGDRVEEGELLFRTRQANARHSVRQAESRLRTARAQLDDLRAWRRTEEVQAARARVESVRSRYSRLAEERERMRVLHERGSVSDSEWDEARTAAESAKADLEMAESELDMHLQGPTAEQVAVAESQIEEAESALETAKQTLDDTEVRAPYSGIVTGRFLKTGDMADRGNSVIELSTIELLEAEMQVPERYSAVLEPGAEVDLAIDALGIERTAVVTHVNPSIDRSTRTFLVKVQVENDDGAIKAGAFAVGTFQLPAYEEAPAVPHQAVHEEEGRFYVWVAENGQAQRAFVDVGEKNDEYVQILTGVSLGQEVVVDGYGALTDGDMLNITPS